MSDEQFDVPDAPPPLLTEAEWQQRAAKADAEQRCAGSLHAPSTISADDHGIPAATTCTCGLVTWTPSTEEAL